MAEANATSDPPTDPPLDEDEEVAAAVEEVEVVVAGVYAAVEAGVVATADEALFGKVKFGNAVSAADVATGAAAAAADDDDDDESSKPKKLSHLLIFVDKNESKLNLEPELLEAAAVVVAAAAAAAAVTGVACTATAVVESGVSSNKALRKVKIEPSSLTTLVAVCHTVATSGAGAPLILVAMDTKTINESFMIMGRYQQCTNGKIPWEFHSFIICLLI